MFSIPTIEIPVPTIEEVGLETYGSMLQERQNLKRIKEDCDARIHQIDEEFGAVLDDKEVKSIVWNDCLVIRRAASKGRPVLDRVLLLEAGVTPQQLKEGTKISEEGKPGVTVRPLSESKAKAAYESTFQ